MTAPLREGQQADHGSPAATPGSGAGPRRPDEGQRAADLLEAGEGWSAARLRAADPGHLPPPPQGGRRAAGQHQSCIEWTLALRPAPETRRMPVPPPAFYVAPALAALGEGISAERALTRPAAVPPSLSYGADAVVADRADGADADVGRRHLDDQMRFAALLLRHEVHLQSRLHAYVFGPRASRPSLARELTASGALASFCEASTAAHEHVGVSPTARAARGMLLVALVGPCEDPQVVRGRMRRLLPCTQADHDPGAAAVAGGEGRLPPQAQLAALVRHLWHVSGSPHLFDLPRAQRIHLTIMAGAGESTGDGLHLAALVQAAGSLVHRIFLRLVTPATRRQAVATFRQLVVAYADAVDAGIDSLAAVQQARHILTAVRDDLTGPYFGAARCFDALLQRRIETFVDTALDDLEAQLVRSPHAAEAVFVAVTDLMATSLVRHSRVTALYRRTLRQMQQQAGHTRPPAGDARCGQD